MMTRVLYVVADMQGRNHLIFARDSFEAEALAQAYFRAGLPIAYLYQPGVLTYINETRTRSLSK